MVDSRQKGYTAEIKARDELRKFTDHTWERVPNSGALRAEHGLKGDLYIPQNNNIFCVEIKHYKDDQITSKLLSGKNPIFMEWWDQTIREAGEVKKIPLLIFKYDRSKWFAAFEKLNFQYSHKELSRYIVLNDDNSKITICLLSEFINLVNKHGSWVK